jgi:hypothetical protein
MAKLRKRKPRPKSPAQNRPNLASREPGNTADQPDRNACLDTLRGFAVVLMVLDHVAGMIFLEQLPWSPIRLATRLSMPLFCLLMGYFLNPARRRIGRRFWEICVAAILLNAVFWPLYQRIEILGSLLIAYLLFLLSGWLFPIFVLSIFLYGDDHLAKWLDYPPTIVVSFVAQGMISRRFGLLTSSVTGAILSAVGLAIATYQPEGFNHLLCYFVLPATWLVHFGSRHSTFRIPGLDCYVAQYYLLFLILYGILDR